MSSHSDGICVFSSNKLQHNNDSYFKCFQFLYFYKVFEKAKGMDNWTDSIYAFIKGPGWFPGTPRLGDPMGVPEVI